MGKVTGFLELDRKDRGYADPKERVRHYKEFIVPHPEPDLRLQAARCMECGIPFCHTGCPVNNLIPDWNHLVYEADWKDALARVGVAAILALLLEEAGDLSHHSAASISASARSASSWRSARA